MATVRQFDTRSSLTNNAGTSLPLAGMFPARSHLGAARKQTGDLSGTRCEIIVQTPLGVLVMALSRESAYLAAAMNPNATAGFCNCKNRSTPLSRKGFVNYLR